MTKDMDISRFTLSACVDWVEVTIYTRSATNPQTIRRSFPKHAGTVSPYVEPMHSGHANGTAHAFKFRVQEPKSAAEFQRLLDQIAARFPFSEAPRITAVEISIDARSKAHDREELVDMTEHFERAHARLINDWRITEPTGRTFEANVSRSRIKEALREGWTLNAGNQDDAIRHRAYVKTTDDAGRTQLPPEDHRARIEVTLAGDELPFETVEEWKRFKFESLAKPYFSFVKRKDDASPLILALDKSESSTRLTLDRSGLNSRLKKSASIQADSQLNSRIAAALRALTVRQSKEKISR